MGLLDGKVAVVTGASSGIGRAAAELFAAEGASVVLNARRADLLAEVAAKLVAAGRNAVSVPGDVTVPATAIAMVDRAVTEFGGLDVAFNNVGLVGPMTPLADMTPETWRLVLDTNLTSAFLAVRAQVPAMLRRGGGSIILTSSFVGNSVGLPGMSAYAAAKAGLLGLVKGITADYAAMGVRANALLPGGTRTEMLTATSEEELAWVRSIHALKRIAAPSEIARAALFLASDLSSFVAGSALWADGGNAAVKS